MTRLGLLVVALLAAACGDSPAAGHDLMLTADTLLGPDTDLLARPVDVAVAPDGALIVADIGLQQVLVLDSTGRLTRRIGREGSGPLEFRLPRSLHATADSVRLVDVGNGRLMVFSRAGDYARVVRGPPGVGIAGMAFNSRGDGLFARHGRDSSLAQRIDPLGALGARLGQLRVPLEGFMDFSQIKADLAAGRVPQALRNYSFPALGEMGSAWILLLVDGDIERYSASDSLLWRTTLPDSLITRLRHNLYRLNRADSAGNQFIFPTVFVAAHPEGDSLWVLLREPDDRPATLLVLDGDGRFVQRITVAGAGAAGAFAWDRRHGVLYLLSAREGILYRARLSGG